MTSSQRPSLFNCGLGAQVGRTGQYGWSRPTGGGQLIGVRSRGRSPDERARDVGPPPEDSHNNLIQPSIGGQGTTQREKSSLGVGSALETSARVDLSEPHDDSAEPGPPPIERLLQAPRDALSPPVGGPKNLHTHGAREQYAEAEQVAQDVVGCACADLWRDPRRV